MKTKILFVSCLLVCIIVQSCDKEENITFEKLPQTARDFINAHFSSENIVYIEYDKEMFDKSYEVFFKSGNKIEFNKSGDWTDINCEHSQVPESAIPEKILEYIKANYENYMVREIDRENSRYEVKLNSGLELIFNKEQAFIGFDS